MAAYVGRDVAKLKSKGGKWKYVPSRLPVSIIHLIHSAACHRVVGLRHLCVETVMQRVLQPTLLGRRLIFSHTLMIAFSKPCSNLIYHLG
jgi:hypothetical protein